jgi:uncharacterized membrane protein
MLLKRPSTGNFPAVNPQQRRLSEFIGRNVEQIARLEAEQIRARSLTERIAGVVTRAAGTATFAVGHVVWFAAWIAVNGGFIGGVAPFDPFPFNLLTMTVSLEAIFLSIWILISQNQMSRQAERREHLDLQINLLAEQESTATLRVVNRIAKHLGIDVSGGPEDVLTSETDIERLASAVDETLPDPSTKPSTLPPPPLRS